jgi:hypothetical protein
LQIFFFSEQSAANSTDDEQTSPQPQISYSTLWFVGLEFKKNLESIDLNLTESIQNFTDLVFKQAQKNGISRPDLSMDAKHVRRKQLKDYLPASILKLDMKLSTALKRNARMSETSITEQTTNTSNAQNQPPTTPSNLRTTLLRNESNDSFLFTQQQSPNSDSNLQSPLPDRQANNENENLNANKKPSLKRPYSSLNGNGTAESQFKKCKDINNTHQQTEELLDPI